MVLGFGRKGPAGVGCYGKLPLHGDYVSHGNDNAAARLFTAWLDAGYRLTGGDDDRDAAEVRFVIPGKRAIFGALWPSADASGTRRFPFALFSTLAGRALSAQEARIPLALDEACAAMTEAMPGILAAAAPDQVQSLVSGIREPEMPEAEALASRFQREALEPHDLGSAPLALVDVLRLTDALSSDKKGDPPSFAIHLPIDSEYAPTLEATAWLEILSRRLEAPTLAGSSHLFLRPSAAGRPGELVVIHRELKAEDLGFILSPTEDYPYGNQLGLDPDDEAVEELAEKLMEQGGGAPTLADLVALACG